MIYFVLLCVVTLVRVHLATQVDRRNAETELKIQINMGNEIIYEEERRLAHLRCIFFLLIN